jgi:hypothetical protein
VSGRIVAPELKGASKISIQNGGSAILSSAVAADGTFTISGWPSMAAGWYSQRLFVTLGGLDLNIAGMRHIRYHNDIRVPAPPVGVDVRVANNSVDIAWAPDTGSRPTSYFLDVGSSPGATDLASIPMAGTRLTAPGVPNGRYYLRVRAANSAGVSAPSAEVVANVGVCAPPLPPSGLAFTLNGSTLSLSWQPSPSGGVVYTILAGSTSGASDIAQAPVGAVTALNAPGVPPGRYFIRIRAVTSCGAADSNEVQVVVGAAQLPGAPGTLAAQVAGSTVSLTWSAATGTVTGYVLEAGSTAGASDLAVVPVGAALVLSAPGVPPGTYFVRVRALNSVGAGPPSNEVIVILP